MRKIAPLILLLMFCTLVFAQTRTITGTIRDANGNILPFATITETGTSNAVTADADGNFKISVGQKSSLAVTSAGYRSQTVRPSGSTLNVSLTRVENQLQEVVVTTALGIRRNRNTLPYAAQTVEGEQISQSRTNNLANALSGKVSGVEIRTGNAMGASSNVVVRGVKSLSYSNQALFVIDGVPFENAINNTTGNVDPDRNQTGGRGGFDYGNAAADINPDDIESLTVLKGAAATALYGSRAANGVVMITTKKARKGLGVTVNSGVTVGRIDKKTFTSYQKQYGAGYSITDYGTPSGPFWNHFDVNGDATKDIVVPSTEDASYGAEFDPNLLVYQWDAFDPTSPYYKKPRPWVAAENDPVSFYETAVLTINSVFIDGGDEKAGFKLGYTRNEEKGIMPNSKLLKNLVNFGASYKIIDKLTAAASINFSGIEGKGRYGTGYDDWNMNQSFRQWMQTNVDYKEQKEAYFRTKQNITWNWADPSKESGLYPIYTDNPYWNRYENYEQDSRNRYFGIASLTYTPADWLNILGRVSLDSYDELQEERVAVGSHDPSKYGRFNRTYREYNYDLIANFNKDITGDLNFKALAGTNIRRTKVNSIYAETNGGLVVPRLYALSNSESPIEAPNEVYQEIAVDGYFAGITLTYQNYLTLDATGRADRASTLPDNNNTYFYPSVSASFLFSKFLTQFAWLSHGKLRANYAEVGNNAPFGSLTDIYDKPTPFVGTTLFSLPDTKNNPDLKPERTESKEIGLEMSFFKSRLGFDFTYYYTKSIDQIFPVAVSRATGYSNKFVNAGTIQNKGIEFSAYANPVKTTNFSWNINVNWTRNRNKVLELYEGAKNLQLTPNTLQGGVTINATVGQPYGTIQGTTWEMLDGQKLVKDNGRYAITTTTNNVIGNVNPDWIGGVYNTLKYKDLSLGFLVDVRKGGDVFSLDLYYGLATGIYPETAALNDLGNPSRDPVAQGGGVIMPGVKADGKPNDIRVENIYGTYGYAYNPRAAFVYDASYVKLREVVLNYSLPQTLINRINPIKGIDLSLIGRNLWIIDKKLPYSDPEENLSAGNVQGYQSGAYPTTRTMGFNIKLRF